MEPPSFRVSAPGEAEAEAAAMPPPGPLLLAVPQQARAKVGVNNPLNRGRPPPPAGGLFPMAGSQQVAGGGSATGNPRNKVGLAKGCSMMDWVRLTKSGKDLTGVGGCRSGGKVREVTRAELRKHRKRKDAWIALNGAVYNVTPYMDFHPGGWEELVQGAGRDATDMFNEIHRWVNYQGLLEACLVGKLVDGPELEEPLEPPPPPPKLASPPSEPTSPTIDFYQTDTNMTVNVYTGTRGLSLAHITVDCPGDRLRVLVRLPAARAFLLHLRLAGAAGPGAELRVGPSGKVEVVLGKASPGRWPGLGAGLEGHLWTGPEADLAQHHRACQVEAVEAATHDTLLLDLRPPASCLLAVPPGHHLSLRAEVKGESVGRSYTPVAGPKGCLRLLVKVYTRGALTPLLGALRPGDAVEVGDPRGSFDPALLRDRTGLLLLAAGTGLTPMLSLLPCLPASPRPALLLFNKTEQDIPVREQLATLALEVEHVLSEAADDWAGARGRIDQELVSGRLEGRGPRPLVLVCGPPGFVREAARLAREGGIAEDCLHLFQG